jgi:hypothetical protein
MFPIEELGKKYYNRTQITFSREGSDITKERLLNKEKYSAATKKTWTPERKEAWVKKMQEWRERDPSYKDKIACKGHSEETKAKMKISRSKRPGTSDETRAKMSEKAQARGEQTAEHNRRLHREKRIGMHGKTHSDQTKTQMSENSRWHH